MVVFQKMYFWEIAILFVLIITYDMIYHMFLRCYKNKT
jgi:hypothetical protein